MTLHTQLSVMENQKVTSDVVKAMQQGSQIMKEQTKHMYDSPTVVRTLFLTPPPPFFGLFHSSICT